MSVQPEHPSLEDIEEARAAGVPWTDLITGRPASWNRQVDQARSYVQFRSNLSEAEDQRTTERGARILRSHDHAPLKEQVWGLPEDPEHPDAADFSDMARALDQAAVMIHTNPARPRHAASTGPQRAVEVPDPPARPLRAL